MRGSRLGSLVLVLLVVVAGLFLSACHNSTPASATTITSVSVSGLVPAIGSTAQFTCTATFSDSSTKDCTDTATWVSFSPAVAKVSSTGVVTAVAAGTSVLKSTYRSNSGTVNSR